MRKLICRLLCTGLYHRFVVRQVSLQVVRTCYCYQYIGDSDVISSYQLFSAILWGKLCEMFVILTSVHVTFSIR